MTVNMGSAIKWLHIFKEREMQLPWGATYVPKLTSRCSLHPQDISKDGYS